MERGHPLSWLLTLDVPQFDSLYSSCDRLEALEVVRTAQMLTLAAHSPKDMKGFLEPFIRTLKKGRKSGTDTAAFLARIGDGF